MFRTEVVKDSPYVFVVKYDYNIEDIYSVYIPYILWMKSSASLIIGNGSSGLLWGTTVVVVAACSLTAVMAWSLAATHRYCACNHGSTTMLSTKLKGLWWQRWRVNPLRSKNQMHQLANPSNENVNDEKDGNTNDSEVNVDSTKGRSRFTTIEDMMIADDGYLRVRPIGIIRSVYRLCVGTPRQGMLAPHARGRIELYNVDDDRTGVAATASVDGLQHYSHIWIVFIFHLNTIGKRKHSKIAPPALGGSKVGVLATRSPHRCNPIGMTLAKLDGIRTVSPSRSANGRKRGAITVLDISGSDLVDGTPVLDIKPYVPTYDAVPPDACIVPNWVIDGLSTARSVQFTEQAEKELHEIVWNDPHSLEFYNNDAINGESSENIYQSIKACIQEVLAVDVRSRHQTNKARLGLSRAEKADRIQQQQHQPQSIPVRQNADGGMCTQQLDNLLVSFKVVESEAIEREESAGSGAEDIVIVQSMCLMDVR
jgi:tRNA-Thr(GGU) m(6)t(6)A37 methyltransferase TsaA